MDAFLVKTEMYSSILLLIQCAVATSCSLGADIFITPLDLEGLSGSCLLIPCHFRVKEGKQFPGDKKAGAVWIKTKSQFETPNSQYVVFNSSRNSLNYPMNVTGKLSEKNCTTVFNNLKGEYTEKYFFRVEAGSFKNTASCSPINIRVRDSPWIPSIEIIGDQTETEVVTITCSAVTPCPHAPPQLTWDLHQDTAHITETNTDGTFTTKITHTLALTSYHDGYNVTCSAAYPVNGAEAKTAQTTITLNVAQPVPEPSAVTWIGPCNIMKLCGIILLYSSFIIFECWFRATYSKKQEQRPEAAATVNCAVVNQS